MHANTGRVSRVNLLGDHELSFQSHKIHSTKNLAWLLVAGLSIRTGVLPAMHCRLMSISIRVSTHVNVFFWCKTSLIKFKQSRKSLISSVFVLTKRASYVAFFDPGTQRSEI